MDEGLDVAVTVFCQNEAARIGACVASLAVAASGLRARLTVIVNGGSDDSGAQAMHCAETARLPARLYTITHADKANAINHALTTLRVPARTQVFVDGYAIVSPTALTGLARALQDNQRAVAATGVAGNGRTMRAATAETLAQGGRLHGQLHALRPDFIDRMVSAGLRLPIGLYRGDGLLGSMACHDLDARGTAWDGHRIAGVAEATYMIPQLSPFRPADITRQARRKVRQMRGRLENAAIKSVIYKDGYEALPDYADDMIAAWLAAGGRAGHGPFMALALRHHVLAVRPAAADLVPEEVK